MTDVIFFLIFVQVILRKITTHFSLSNLQKKKKRWNNPLSTNNSKKHMTIKAFELWDSWGSQNWPEFSLMTSEPHVCAIDQKRLCDLKQCWCHMGSFHFLANATFWFEISIPSWKAGPCMGGCRRPLLSFETMLLLLLLTGHWTVICNWGQVVLKSLQDTPRKLQTPEGEGWSTVVWVSPPLSQAVMRVIAGHYDCGQFPCTFTKVGRKEKFCGPLVSLPSWTSKISKNISKTDIELLTFCCPQSSKDIEHTQSPCIFASVQKENFNTTIWEDYDLRMKSFKLNKLNFRNFRKESLYCPFFFF